MKCKRYLFFAALLFFLSTGQISALEIKTGALEEIKGVVIARHWYKSLESYCQGGSEYYVLKKNDTGDELTLNSARDPENKEDNFSAFDKMQEQLKQFVGKRVVVKGQLVHAHFSQKEHCPDPIMQCIAGAIACSWFRVAQIYEEK